MYGDPGYTCSDVISAPFQGHISPEEKEVNTRMSACRVSIEWAFGEVLQYFAFVDFPKQMKIMEKPVASMYECAVFFTNLITISRGGNKTSIFFHMKTPTFQEYLHSLN